MEASYPVAYNLGCGACHWPGWINVDLNSNHADLCSDIRNLKVIASDSADAVAAIHVLEHFYEWEAFDLLTEWKRILRPGGLLILELPCMDKILGYALSCVQTKTPMMPFMTLHALYGDPKHKDPLMAHKFGWFTTELRRLLEEVGMRDIQFPPPRYHFQFRDMRAECIK